MLVSSIRVESRCWYRVSGSGQNVGIETWPDGQSTNEDLLRTLFLDSLIIGRYVVISQDIVANRIEAKKNIDVERETKEEKKKEKEHLQNDLVMKLKKKTTRLNNEEERDRARLFTPSTPIAIVKSSLSTFFFAFFLKRIAIDQDVSSRKRTKLLDSKLLA